MDLRIYSLYFQKYLRTSLVYKYYQLNPLIEVNYTKKKLQTMKYVSCLFLSFSIAD